MEFDYAYLCDNLGHLCGLQTRLYQGGTLAHQYSFYDLEPDLVSLILPKMQAAKQKVAFFDAVDVLLFGTIWVPDKNIRIVVGPTSALRPSVRQAKAVLHELGELDAKLPALNTYLDNMVCYPLENFLQILCFCSYALNGEKMTVAGLLEQQAEGVHSARQKARTAHTEPESPSQHNTVEMEKLMLGYITAGQTAKLEQLFSAPPTGRAGRIAHDSLRQQKNLLVCTATLVSRAAIAGGLSPETALTLSDMYIQKAELIESMAPLSTLNMLMVLDYARRVEQLKVGETSTPFARSAAKYVAEHIESKITTGQLAGALYMNRQYLCKRFKQETGMTVGEYIAGRKIDEAKRLLSTTAMSVAQISDFLGFSSQSYFQNVFKRAVGMTPKAYREAVSQMG